MRHGGTEIAALWFDSTFLTSQTALTFMDKYAFSFAAGLLSNVEVQVQVQIHFVYERHYKRVIYNLYRKTCAGHWRNVSVYRG